VSVGPADGVCSFMRVPGSPAVLVAALEDAAAGGGSRSLVDPLLNTIISPMLSILTLTGRPPTTDEALAAWCAAALAAGALPALRRLLATERRGRVASAVRLHAASAASLLALVAAEPVAASTVAAGVAVDSASEGPAGAAPERRPDEAPRWHDDPAVSTALDFLLGCVTGAPAWGSPWGGARRPRRGVMEGALAGTAACAGHWGAVLRPRLGRRPTPWLMLLCATLLACRDRAFRPQRLASRSARAPFRTGRPRRRRREHHGDRDVADAHSFAHPGRAVAAAVSPAGAAAGRRAAGRRVPVP
jgi:hypothetical protein